MDRLYAMGVILSLINFVGPAGVGLTKLCLRP